tara:strand:- start:615 stop:1127 length:513 start_codon:yes stop_codon:yes gene_type:complete
MAYRLYTEEKVLYHADSNANGIHVSFREKKGTTLRGLIKSLVGKKMIVDVHPVDCGRDEYYRTTLLGKVYLKVMQLEFAKRYGKDYDRLFKEVAYLIGDAVGVDVAAEMGVLLVKSKEHKLQAKDHKGELAMRIINRMGLLQGDVLSAKGEIYLMATHEEYDTPPCLSVN